MQMLSDCNLEEILSKNGIQMPPANTENENSDFTKQRAPLRHSTSGIQVNKVITVRRDSKLQPLSES